MEQPGQTVVVTGFGPFGEHAVNASWTAVQLVVHVGVSGLASSVTLESCGHNSGYCRPDNRDFSPCSGCCVDGGPDCLSSVIDMDAVCCRLAARGLDVALSTSQDAGSFISFGRRDTERGRGDGDRETPATRSNRTVREASAPPPAGSCVTSPTSCRCCRGAAERPSCTCPPWAAPTRPGSWAWHSGPWCWRCWRSWGPPHPGPHEGPSRSCPLPAGTLPGRRSDGRATPGRKTPCGLRPVCRTDH
ncbi:pyroglutamyl-peptidase 1 isoform X2 [Erinaceus europaeus]|uniref:Pyroglutamyl-peptidase 1 isoform X2 n=1 Tax=Erinaceus europaeus TaxID=9365 RepID=A0ABM3WP99_ERIEU|nr:pyroglutamyl-peptidase 1 isoform X2 [Erinaceus europaeus]